MINENNPGFALPETILAWRSFVGNGSLGPYPVRSIIAESWQRCRLAGVDAFGGESHDILAPEALDVLLEKRQDLIRIARPLMDRLYRFVAGSGFIVMLTDERGYIMETIGDRETMDNAVGLNFIPGARWSEEEVGTNAIGTGIYLKQPLQVLGAEHFCVKHHPWTCSGAPIFDQQGEMIGFLDFSGPYQLNHLHSLGMVVAAVEAIMDQMGLERQQRELIRTNRQLSNIFNTMSDGVILTDCNGVITQINPIAEAMLGSYGLVCSGMTLQQLFGRTNVHLDRITNGHEYNDMELIIDYRNRRIHCVVSSTAIRDDQGKLDEVVILVRPMDKVEKLINRFSGTRATYCFKDIIYRSPQMENVLKTASVAARGNANILLQGESGTGKEVIAQAIHNRSTRRKGPFIALNCGAIPRDLVASELFGYVEGAFTGACRGGRPGKFELASGGTLFLDEIADMPLEQQVALLRVLQEKEVTRIGGDKAIPVDVRVICATNKDLRQEAQNGNFRQDLYYRLNVISILIPPLRERREDIRTLFEHFLNRMIGSDGIAPAQVEPEVMRYLENYDWPGNVRELQNVVERLVNIVEEPIIRVQHLPVDITAPGRPVVKERSLAQRITEPAALRRYKGEKEREQIMAALSRHEGNVSQTARELGISRNTLYRKLRTYQIGH